MSEGNELDRSPADSIHEIITLDPYEVISGCIQCGTCSGVCPFGYLMDYPPSRIISAVRSGLFEKVMQTDTVWMCVSCSACSQVCPAQILVTDGVMSRTKEKLILAGKVPTELQNVLENSQRYGNSMGESPRKRMDWVQGVQLPVPFLGRDKHQCDVLWYVGDYAAYNLSAQPATRAFYKILRALGIDFGLLGAEEFSDGDSQRLAGEHGLFELLAEKNGRAFGKYEFNEIITTDPHAFNAFINEYPKLGISYPVKHYTQFLAERIEQLAPLLKKPLGYQVTFHDPCYLGRVNGEFETPRELLNCIPGLTLVEMPHSKTTSLCCGGGGGGMWLEGFSWEKAKIRLSELRVQEATGVGADVLAVACPYEPSRFLDATKTVAGVTSLQIRDIAELIVESME